MRDAYCSAPLNTGGWLERMTSPTVTSSFDSCLSSTTSHRVWFSPAGNSAPHHCLLNPPAVGGDTGERNGEGKKEKSWVEMAVQYERKGKREQRRHTNEWCITQLLTTSWLMPSQSLSNNSLPGQLQLSPSFIAEHSIWYEASFRDQFGSVVCALSPLSSLCTLAHKCKRLSSLWLRASTAQHMVYYQYYSPAKSRTQHCTTLYEENYLSQNQGNGVLNGSLLVCAYYSPAFSSWLWVWYTYILAIVIKMAVIFISEFYWSFLSDL